MRTEKSYGKNDNLMFNQLWKGRKSQEHGILVHVVNKHYILTPYIPSSFLATWDEFFSFSLTFPSQRTLLWWVEHTVCILDLLLSSAHHMKYISENGINKDNVAACDQEVK